MRPSTLIDRERGVEFATLLDSHQRLIFKVANAYACDADVADLAQEIAAQLWRAFPSYDRSRRFSTWMYRIALNVSISWLRSETPRRQRVVAFDAGIHDQAADAGDEHDDDRRQILLGFLGAQDPLNRALLLLYLDEHSYEEMSEILGASVTNLTTKIGQLKERLRIYAERHHGTR